MKHTRAPPYRLKQGAHKINEVLMFPDSIADILLKSDPLRATSTAQKQVTNFAKKKSQ